MRFILFAVLIVLNALATAAEPRVVKDVAYAEPKHERQTLDVYAPVESPAKGAGRPVVFWIHGGGWQRGDKADVKHKPQALVDRGYVFVSTNYRLLPDVKINQMAGDIARAIRWVHDHAKEYGGDGERLIVGGHSAGAQLAALVCTDERYLKAEGLPLSIVKGCVPVDGDTYDVPLQIATVEERRANIYRQKFGDEASQRDLSPIHHLAAHKGIPPVLILHVADHPETKLQSERLVKALSELKIPAKTYAAEGKNHTTLNDDLGTPDDKPTAAMMAFLEECLK